MSVAPKLLKRKYVVDYASEYPAGTAEIVRAFARKGYVISSRDAAEAYHDWCRTNYLKDWIDLTARPKIFDKLMPYFEEVKP